MTKDQQKRIANVTASLEKLSNSPYGPQFKKTQAALSEIKSAERHTSAIFKKLSDPSAKLNSNDRQSIQASIRDLEYASKRLEELLQLG